MRDDRMCRLSVEYETLKSSVFTDSPKTNHFDDKICPRRTKPNENVVMCGLLLHLEMKSEFLEEEDWAEGGEGGIRQRCLHLCRACKAPNA